jgi:hypothetical protein
LRVGAARNIRFAGDMANRAHTLRFVSIGSVLRCPGPNAAKHSLSWITAGSPHDVGIVAPINQSDTRGQSVSVDLEDAASCALTAAGVYQATGKRARGCVARPIGAGRCHPKSALSMSTIGFGKCARSFVSSIFAGVRCEWEGVSSVCRGFVSCQWGGSSVFVSVFVLFI